ncbi:MAG: alanine racemase [Acidobacteriota bacterium]|nr:alanine racemase [Acidobacteriota bacterium]
MSQLSLNRPTWAEISLSALIENYRTLKRQLTGNAQLMAIVKANAYGHGAVECARALAEFGADWFGVALVEEGIELRQAGIKRPVFCLGGFWRTQGELILAHDLTPALFRMDLAEELNARATEAGRIVNFHLKVDTGMGRLGVPFSNLIEFARALKQFEHLKLDGVMTHFADADGIETDYTESQIRRFEESVVMLRELGFQPTWRHAANSAGLHAFPQAHGNLARAGAAMYGLTRDVLSPRLTPPLLRPVMALKSRIVMLKTVHAGTALGYGCSFITERESKIATLPVGYADGFRRALSNKGRVLIRGQFAPVVGRVSMDLTMIDVTDVPGVELGDEATLLGKQDNLKIVAEDLAEQIGTISYEIVTGISARVPRQYIPA